MKKIYEVPSMEIVRLDASENIAKLPVAGEDGKFSNDTEAKTTIRTEKLMNKILGITSSDIEQ